MDLHIQVFLKALAHGDYGSTTAADINIFQAAFRITELIEVQSPHQLYTDLGKSILAHLTVDTVLMVRQQPGMSQMNINMKSICKQLFHLLHPPLDHTGNLMSVPLENKKAAGCTSQIQDSIFLIFILLISQLIVKKVLTGRHLRSCKRQLQTCLSRHQAKLLHYLQRRCRCKKLHLIALLVLLFLRLFLFLFLFGSLLQLLAFGHFLSGTPGIIKNILL